MNNLSLYLLTVLIWGSTWIAITFQLGVVDPLVSVAYRFGLAATLLMLYCFWRGLNMRFSWKSHAFMALQGALLFALNYWLFYMASANLTSGLVALMFSGVVILNMLNSSLFLGTKIERRVVIGALIGLSGMAFVFWPEITHFSLSDGTAWALILSAFATLSASLGNITSARNQRNQLPVLQSNAFGMTYGALLMAAVAVFTGKTFNFEWSVMYISSLLYLAIFGSIVAFGCYLTLIGRIGAGRAAYVTLLFPIVALGLSTVMEGYQWHLSGLFGIILILLGNFLVLTQPKILQRWLGWLYRPSRRVAMAGISDQ